MHRLTESQLIHIIRQADSIPFEKEFVDLLRQELNRRNRKHASPAAGHRKAERAAATTSKSD